MEYSLPTLRDKKSENCRMSQIQGSATADSLRYRLMVCSFSMDERVGALSSLNYKYESAWTTVWSGPAFHIQLYPSDASHPHLRNVVAIHRSSQITSQGLIRQQKMSWNVCCMHQV